MDAARQKSIYANPALECDLVMKGGVTSGLVYPPAVLELARTVTDPQAPRPGYRFRGIGGTSAGAVAAALAAAAELNRANGGFEALEEVRDELQRQEPEGSFLQNLFQADAGMEPLLDLVLRLDDYKSNVENEGLLATASKVFEDTKVPRLFAASAAGAFAGIAAAAAVAGVIALAANVMTGSAAAFWPAFGVLAFILAGAGWWAGRLYRGFSSFFRMITVDLPKNYFGICSGMKVKNHPAAADWLHASVQKIAGRRDDDRSQVLTFGDLHNHKVDGQDKPIMLELMTTNISEGRPYALPFDEPFIFRADDFRRLLPPAVFEATIAGAERRKARFPNLELPQGYYLMPDPADLPIVVAARMSMSFPLFFSSIPLYALPIDQRGDLASAPGTGDEDDLITHWFSDGGIASNFPIHFFDSWLPTRPTFGITLRYLPEYYEVQAGASEEQRLASRHYNASAPLEKTPAGAPVFVTLPKPNNEVPSEWSHIRTPSAASSGLGAVPSFLWSVIGSMQNYRDNMQAGLASYRERISQIRLRPGQGGFNLDMSGPEIERIADEGRQAGAKLDVEYNDLHHCWTRLRVLLAELDSGFRSIRRNKTDEVFAALIEQQLNDPGEWPYGLKNAQACQGIEAQLKALSNAMDEWIRHNPCHPFNAGLPPPLLRVTPKI